MKKNNPFLIPIALSLIVGFLAGYAATSAGLVSYLGAAVSRSRTGTLGSQLASQSVCQRQNPNERWSKQDKYAYCEPFKVQRQKSTITLYTCNNVACGGVASGDIYSNPAAFGFADDPNSDLYFQSCSLQACWDGLKYGYYWYRR